jgi:NCAIR mutase (PurE)-related protein
MDPDRLRIILEELSQGRTSVPQALEQLKLYPYEPIDAFANLDHHRALRTGFPEVIYAEGKTPEQVAEIFQRLADLERGGSQVLATRVSPEMYAQLQEKLPEAVYHPAGRVLTLDRQPERPRTDGIVVVTAGTADIPVAEEAAITAELMGNRVCRIFDVGVAGLHRLLDRLPALQQGRVIVVVAGMEGALPSVVGGLVAAPVIAVPTSVGYGASFGGVAALLGMLNSCASGIAVVNIDNGFGAGTLAAKINRLAAQEVEK